MTCVWVAVLNFSALSDGVYNKRAAPLKETKDQVRSQNV